VITVVTGAAVVSEELEELSEATVGLAGSLVVGGCVVVCEVGDVVDSDDELVDNEDKEEEVEVVVDEDSLLVVLEVVCEGADESGDEVLGGSVEVGAADGGAVGRRSMALTSLSSNLPAPATVAAQR
jgi:hypothetical protein